MWGMVENERGDVTPWQARDFVATTCALVSE